MLIAPDPVTTIWSPPAAEVSTFATVLGVAVRVLPPPTQDETLLLRLDEELIELDEELITAGVLLALEDELIGFDEELVVTNEELLDFSEEMLELEGTELSTLTFISVTEFQLLLLLP